MQLFVLPQENIATLFAWDGTKLLPLARLPIPVFGNFNIEGNCISFINRKQSRVVAFRWDGERLVTHQSITLPVGFKGYCSKVVGDCLFVGGRSQSGEIVGFYDLTQDKPQWQSIYVPPTVRRAGKSIDDIILTVDMKLIAVDNMIFPKYLLAYDATDPRNPVLEKVSRLPNNGAYEHIRKADSNGLVHGLLSSSVGMSGCHQFINLLDATNCHQVGSIGHKSDTDDSEENPYWVDFSLVGESAVIAGGKFGITAVRTDSFRRYHEQFIYRMPSQIPSGASIERVHKIDDIRFVVVWSMESNSGFGVVSVNELEHSPICHVEVVEHGEEPSSSFIIGGGI
ncbi:MAG: hypothetical protein OEM52_08170 [bacterium]|nr:hypothetical protein [bacterium]